MELGLRMVAAYPGPGTLGASARFQGRRYVGVGETVKTYTSDSLQTGDAGKTVVRLGSDEWWTDDPDPSIRSVGLGGLSEIGATGLRMSEHQVWEVALGPQGYVRGDAAEAGGGGFAEGHYRVRGVQELDVWIGEALPAAYGEPLQDVTEGAPAALSGHGLQWITGMCVSGDRLWVTGEDAGGVAKVMGWDGADWIEAVGAPDLLWVWDVAGVLHGCGVRGCWKMANWQWEALSWGGQGGAFGIAADGKARWIGSAVAGWTVYYPEAPVVIAGGTRFGLIGRGGRAYVVQDSQGGLYGEPHQELAWIDGAQARGLVKWRKSGATLDNLALWANRLWGFGVNADGTPVRLRLSSGTANIEEMGPWRIDQAQGDPMLAIGRLRGLVTAPTGGTGIGQVVLEASGEVMLHSLTHEASDGTGETPELQELRHEAVLVPTPPVQLDSIAHEASDGTGDTPELWEIVHEGRDGTGDTPELWEIVHEAIEIPATGTVALRELIHEAAQGIPGPGVGEYVRFHRCQARGNVDMVRIALSEPLSEDWRAIIRLDRQGMDVDAWDTYEDCPLMANHSPAQTGSYLEVGIIGPWDLRWVNVTVAYRCG